MMHASLTQPLPGPLNFSIRPEPSRQEISDQSVNRLVTDEKRHAGLLTEEMVRLMLSLVDPTGENSLDGEASTGSKACEIIRFDPSGDTGPLEETIRAFKAQKGRPGDRLGCVLTSDGCHFVALCLQKDQHGGHFFRYYDPSPSASSRHTLKEQICQCLCRCDIDLEGSFTVARPGDVKQPGTEVANDSGIYAVLALQKMMKGRSQFNAAAQDVIAWKDKLFAAADAASQAAKSDIFMQTLAGRSENAGKLARRFAGHCPAIQYVFDCYSSREMARFQGLNKRMYYDVLPQVMDHVSFQDYPVMPLVNLQKLFTGESDSAAIIDLPHEFSPAYLGWLMLSGMSIHVNLNPERMQNFLKKTYADFEVRCKKYSQKDRDAIVLSDWLGKAVIAGSRIPHGMQSKNSRVQGSHSASMQSAGRHDDFPKQLSIVDMCLISPALPESLMKDIETKLDEAVMQGVISSSTREMVLDNLHPVIRHLAKRSMEINIGVLPKVKEGQEKRYVYVRATPSGHNGIEQKITMYKAEESLTGENKSVLLSTRLKQDIRQHFHKMGWTNRLGPTFQDKALLPKIQNNHEIKMLSLLIRQLACRSCLSNERRHFPIASHSPIQNMDVVSRMIYQTLKKVVPDIGPGIFERDILNPAVSNIEALCRVSSGLLKVAKHFMATRSMSTEELLKFQTMLTRCRKRLLEKVGQSGNEAPDEGETFLEAKAYTEVNNLNDGIDEINARLAMAM